VFFRLWLANFRYRLRLIPPAQVADKQSAEDLMNRARALMPALLVLLTPAFAWPAPPADARGAESPLAVSGSYSVSFNVNLDAVAPAGTAILCRARIAPNLPSFQNLSQKMVPVESATGVATVSGNTANCSVQIPFSWAVSDPRSGVTLSYEIDAVSGAAARPTPVRARQAIGVAYPATGGTANLVVNVRL
jgi:hypothetical protein